MCVCFGGVQHKRLKDRNSYLIRKLREHGLEHFRDDRRYHWLYWRTHESIWGATVRAACSIARKRHEKTTSMDALREVLHEEETKRKILMDKMISEVRGVE